MLYSGISCIVDLIVKDGLINLDLADVKTVLMGMGAAMMGTGEASGEQRAIVAAEEAIVNPLLDDVTLKGARSLLLSITGGRDLTLLEVEQVANTVRAEVDPDANIIVGATIDESLGDKVRVSIVASGMGRAAHATNPEIWAPRAQRSASRASGPGDYRERLARPCGSQGRVPWPTQRNRDLAAGVSRVYITEVRRRCRIEPESPMNYPIHCDTAQRMHHSSNVALSTVRSDRLRCHSRRQLTP